MKYETNRAGLAVPDHSVLLSGHFHIKHMKLTHGRPDWWAVRELIDEFDVGNLVVNQGLNHILGVELNGVTQITRWYLGLFQGNYMPVATDTAATIAGNSTESSSYTSATRPLWQPAAASGQSITNSANPAVFTFNAGVMIYGAFLISMATIGGGGAPDILLAAAQFASPKTVSDGDQLLVTYTLNDASA